MHRTLIALVLFTGACAVASTQPPPSGGDGGPTPDGAVDGASGQEAASATRGVFCGEPGFACTSPNDCCSGECTGATAGKPGYCYDPPAQCAGNGSACTTDDECCSLTCTNGSCAQGCAEMWTDCSSSTCCQGTCTDNVCQLLGPICGGLGASCTSDVGCCSQNCSNGMCAMKTCAERGSTCTAASDCCTGTCVDGVCADKPQCGWGGPCTSNFQCCTGTCKMNGQVGQCAPPVGNTVCKFLERGKDTGFANCFDCISSSCCEAEYSDLNWAACFQDCMSSFDTWDSWATCTSKCGTTPSSLSSCVTGSCSMACPTGQP